MSKIIVLAGPKQSGKTSGANYITGMVLKENSKLRVFELNEYGELFVNAVTIAEDGSRREIMGQLDMFRTDPEFVHIAAQTIWPYVKIYNFADTLKTAIQVIFGVQKELLYGNDSDKNTLTDIPWKNMTSFLPPRTIKKLKDNGKYEQMMTVRELLQFFGTDICRKIKDSCWVDACFNRIIAENPEVAIIADCRFVNEVKRAKQLGGYIIRLSRETVNDLHESEIQLNNVPNNQFDLILPPKEQISLVEQSMLIHDAIMDWGIITPQLQG